MPADQIRMFFSRSADRAVLIPESRAKPKRLAGNSRENFAKNDTLPQLRKAHSGAAAAMQHHPSPVCIATSHGSLFPDVSDDFVQSHEVCAAELDKLPDFREEKPQREMCAALPRHFLKIAKMS
jgi:hypothetical protein